METALAGDKVKDQREIINIFGRAPARRIWGSIVSTPRSVRQLLRHGRSSDFSISQSYSHAHRVVASLQLHQSNDLPALDLDITVVTNDFASLGPNDQIVAPDDQSSGAVDFADEILQSIEPTSEKLATGIETLDEQIAELDPESSPIRDALERRRAALLDVLRSRPRKSDPNDSAVHRVLANDVLANGSPIDKARVFSEEARRGMDVFKEVSARTSDYMRKNPKILLRDLQNSRSRLSVVAARSFTLAAAEEMGFSAHEIEHGREIHFFDRYLAYLTALEEAYGDDAPEGISHELNALSRHYLRNDELEEEFVSVFDWISGQETRGFAKVIWRARPGKREFEEWLDRKEGPWNNLVANARRTGKARHVARADNRDKLARGTAAFTAPFGIFGAILSALRGGTTDDQIAAAGMSGTLGNMFSPGRSRPPITHQSTSRRAAMHQPAATNRGGKSARQLPGTRLPQSTIAGSTKPTGGTMTNPIGSENRSKNCVRCTAATIRNITDSFAPLPNSRGWWTADTIGKRFNIPAHVKGGPTVSSTAVAEIRSTLPRGYSIPMSHVPADRIKSAGIYVAIYSPKSGNGHAFVVKASHSGGKWTLRVIDDQKPNQIGRELSRDNPMFNSRFYPLRHNDGNVVDF